MDDHFWWGWWPALILTFGTQLWMARRRRRHRRARAPIELGDLEIGRRYAVVYRDEATGETEVAIGPFVDLEYSLNDLGRVDRACIGIRVESCLVRYIPRRLIVRIVSVCSPSGPQPLAPST